MKMATIIMTVLILSGCGQSKLEKCLEAVDNAEIQCEVNGGNGTPLGCGFEATVQRTVCEIKHGKG